MVEYLTPEQKAKLGKQGDIKGLDFSNPKPELNRDDNIEIREKVLKLLGTFNDLTTEEKDDFLKILENVKVANLISIMNIIQKRFRNVEALEKLLFDKSLKAKEVEHIQPVVEASTWLFGEEYNILGSVEDKFEKILRRFRNEIFAIDEKITINHPDKQKEVDLFLCKNDYDHENNSVKNIIIELKRPSINAGAKEFEQISKYMDVIKKQDEFNGNNITWEYILIVNKYDSFIGHLRHTAKGTGKEGIVLASEDGKHKIYIRTWAELLTQFRLKHEFLKKELKDSALELLKETKNPDEVVD